MASTEDFGGRLESIERHLAELDQVVKRSPTQPSSDPMARISPAGWLKVQGPVFAAMALGFGLLWSGQQTLGSNMLAMQQSTHVQFLELTRTTARLEGSMDRLDTAIGELRDEVKHLSERVDRLTERVDRVEG